MGKSQETLRKLLLAYGRLSLKAQSPISDRRERRGYGGGSPILAFFLRMFHIRQDAPQQAAGFFIERRENLCKKVNALTTPF
jgi:hypothetical protein